VALDPSLRVALVDPRGNINPNLDSITLSELAAELGVSTTLVEQTLAIGANASNNDGDNFVPPAVGYMPNNYGGSGVSASQMFLQPGGGNIVATQVFAGLDGRRWIQPHNTLGNPGLWFWRPTGSPQVLGFARTWATGLGGDGPPLPSVSIEGWIRKRNAGDGSNANFFFGFTSDIILVPSAQAPRIGLIGDGVGGYRFGSVNCPDGAAGVDGPAAIDANAVQPANLVDPGANAFYVKIKLIPATATTPGMWAAYLGGSLVAVFDQLANLPRGYFSGAPVNNNYVGIECGFGNYTDGVGDITAPLVGDGVRVVVANEWGT
jgi:hypothetical protein